MLRKILINSNRYETRVAILENSKLVEFFLERQQSLKSKIGNIYKGKVKQVIPGLKSAFIDINLNKSAFIHIDDIPKNRTKLYDTINPNNEIMVQILKLSESGKGSKVTSYISIPGRFLVLMPMSSNIRISKQIKHIKERERLKNTILKLSKNLNLGYIIRTAAEGVDEKKLKYEINILNKIWINLQKRYKSSPAPSLIHNELNLSLRIVRDLFIKKTDILIVDCENTYKSILSFLDIFNPELKDSVKLYSNCEPLFESYNLEKEIQRSMNKKIWLKSGGYILIEHTEALTAIDVNTGKYIGKNSLEKTITKINIEAAREIARQVRIQNIGGIIVIDFIGMKDTLNQEKIFLELTIAFSKDKNRNNILPMSELGLIQISRKKTNLPMSKLLYGSCKLCKGTGQYISKETISINIYREILKNIDEIVGFEITLHVNPEMAEFLKRRERSISILSCIEKKIESHITIDEKIEYDLEIFDITVAASK